MSKGLITAAAKGVSPQNPTPRQIKGARTRVRNIGVDFALGFNFRENNSKNLARCDIRTPHPVIAALRKVQHEHSAPCNVLMLHLATSRYHTLPLSPIAQCDSKSPLLASEIARPAIGLTFQLALPTCTP